MQCKQDARVGCPSRKRQARIVETYRADHVADMLASRAAEWRPTKSLRLKNAGSYHWTKQLGGFFVGLLPELEEHIQKTSIPTLRITLRKVRQSYLDSWRAARTNAQQIFKLLFWTLTCKGFF